MSYFTPFCRLLVLAFSFLYSFYVLPYAWLHSLSIFLFAFHLLPSLPPPPPPPPRPLPLPIPSTNIDSKSLQSEKIETEMWGWVCIWRGVWVSHFCVAGESHFLSGCKLARRPTTSASAGWGSISRFCSHTLEGRESSLRGKSRIQGEWLFSKSFPSTLQPIFFIFSFWIILLSSHVPFLFF